MASSPFSLRPSSFDEAVRAALEEADKGVFVSSEAAHRWMESWDTDNELPIPEPDIFPDDHKAPSRKRNT
jgi:hypothetical protein